MRNRHQCLRCRGNKGESKNYGLTGNWSLVSKDGGTTTTYWSSNYSKGGWTHTGGGLIVGYASEDYDKSASGSYTDGIKEGNYSETFKSDGAAGELIFLSRASEDAWIGSGAKASSGSGSVDISNKWSSFVISPTVGGTLTTKTDSDSGQHYEYDLSTAQGLWKNEWREETGSGTGQGSGWAYLTTDTSGTSMITISPPSDPLELYFWGSGAPAEKQLTRTIKGDSSDKLNYSYNDEFTLTKTGWSTSETGSGTWKKSDHYESRANGSVSESGNRKSPLFSSEYKWGTNLRFQASTSLDVETVRDSKSTATFNWSNDEWTVTEKTKTSGRSHDYRVSEFGAQLWHSSGNVGAGNGGVGTANMSWSSTRRDDVTESSETTKSITSGKSGVVWNAKYTSHENDVTTISLDEVRHSESHGRLNTVTNGDYSTAKSDSTEDLVIHNKSKQSEETNEHWESSFDGKAYGTTIDTFDETITSESTTFNKWDDETLSTSKSWNASGIISQYAWGAAYHTLTEGSTSSTETEIDTSAGYQPTFMVESLLGKGIFTAVSLQGAGAAGASKFEFTIPTMTFTAGGAITLGQLPQVRLGTTDFDQIGQAVDTRTYWQKLKDLVVTETWALVDAGVQKAEAVLETAVWVVDKIGAGVRYVGNLLSEYSTEILDGIELGNAGFTALAPTDPPASPADPTNLDDKDPIRDGKVIFVGKPEDVKKVMEIWKQVKERALKVPKLNNALAEIIEGNHDVTIAIVRDSKNHFGGAYKDGIIDLGDIESFGTNDGPNSQQAEILLHEVVEQWYKKSNDLKNSRPDFRKAHR